MSRKVFDQMDFDHNGHITQAEYLRLNGRRAGEECVPAAFNAMDINENRMVISNLGCKKYCCQVLISGKAYFLKPN